MQDEEFLKSISVVAAMQRFRIYGVIVLDITGSVVTWNHGATELLGYTEEEARGSHFEFIFTPEDRALGVPASEIENALSQNEAYDDRWHLRKDQTRIYVNGGLSMVQNEKGEARGFLKILRDETDKMERVENIEQLNRQLKQAHQELRAHAAQLEEHVSERTHQLNERNAELEAFCYSIAHDLRAPLRSIQAMSQVVIEDYGGQMDATCQDYLNRISRAGQRLDQLTLDLLKYSRLSREDIHLTPVSLDLAIEEVVGSMQEMVKEKGAQVEVRPPFPRVHAQYAYLVQILSNFLSNALKFVDPGINPRIEIWSETKGNRVRLLVRDHGIGIPEEYREKIFQLFERLHPDGTFEGTGVGLAIAFKAAMRINGSIGLEADQGQGTTFWLDVELAA